MKIYYNNYFPFGNYYAINLFGIVIARSDYGPLKPAEINHEYIHTLQQRELLFVGFYLLYFIEWLCRLACYRSWHKAYSNLSFEREAYFNETDMNYRTRRKLYSWIRYLSSH